MDNKVYGHINYAVYYSYFDTVVSEYLLSSGVPDISGGEVIGLVARGVRLLRSYSLSGDGGRLWSE